MHEAESLHRFDWILDKIETGGKNSKPAILSWTQGLAAHELLLDIRPELVFFQGHFPDKPILPGIVQLNWAAGAAMNLFKFNEIPADIKRLKFKSIIQPPLVVQLLLELKNDTDVQFQYVSDETVHSMGCLVFKEGLSCDPV